MHIWKTITLRWRPHEHSPRNCPDLLLVTCCASVIQPPLCVASRNFCKMEALDSSATSMRRAMRTVDGWRWPWAKRRTQSSPNTFTTSSQNLNTQNGGTISIPLTSVYSLIQDKCSFTSRRHNQTESLTRGELCSCLSCTGGSGWSQDICFSGECSLQTGRTCRHSLQWTSSIQSVFLRCWRWAALIRWTDQNCDRERISVLLLRTDQTFRT